MSRCSDALFVALLVLWLAPLAIVGFDLGCWFLFDHQCTTILWNQGRTFFVICWTVGPLFVLGFLS